MKKSMIVLMMVISGAGFLWGDAVTYTVTSNGSLSQYQFTLTNTGATGGTLFDLFLLLPTDISNINTATIGSPVGWGDGTGGLVIFGPDAAPGTSFIDWSADASGAFDVGIGNSLSGYSFRSTQPLGVIQFALNGAQTFEVAQNVPEPGTLALLATLLVPAAFGLLRANRDS